MLSDLSGANLIVVILSIVFSLSLHEAMHGFAAHWLGDDTAQREGRLTLNPLKHIDPMMTVVLPVITLLVFHVPLLAAKPVPFNPDRVKYDEFGGAIIAAAGPFTNLLLAIIADLAIKILHPSFDVVHALNIFASLNVTLFVFNLIPIPPLDGSRILYAFAPERLQELMRQFEPIGLFVVFGLVLAANLGSFVAQLSQSVFHLLP